MDGTFGSVAVYNSAARLQEYEPPACGVWDWVCVSFYFIISPDFAGLSRWDSTVSSLTSRRRALCWSNSLALLSRYDTTSMYLLFLLLLFFIQHKLWHVVSLLPTRLSDINQDIDDVKAMFTHSSITVLALTYAVTMLHVLFDFLAFKVGLRRNFTLFTQFENTTPCSTTAEYLFSAPCFFFSKARF